MNDQNNDLTSGLQDFFADDTAGNKTGNAVGGIGVGVLHLVVFAFAIYSGYHGISATRTYHSGNGYGYGDGYGDGSGYGDGYGNGSGYGNGDGYDELT